MRNVIGSFILCAAASLPAFAQEGFSPTLPFGTRTEAYQAGGIRGGGFSPTLPFGTKAAETPSTTTHADPHQDCRPNYNTNNYYRGYNYYYGPGNYYNNGYSSGYNNTNNGQYTMPTSNQEGPPGYNTPAPSTAPPGY